MFVACSIQRVITFIKEFNVDDNKSVRKTILCERMHGNIFLKKIKNGRYINFFIPNYKEFFFFKT